MNRSCMKLHVYAINWLPQMYPTPITIRFVPIQSISRKGAIISFHVDITIWKRSVSCIYYRTHIILITLNLCCAIITQAPSSFLFMIIMETFKQRFYLLCLSQKYSDVNFSLYNNANPSKIIHIHIWNT